MILIQWDAKKAEGNFKKHGVGFEEAATVLWDPNVLEFYDRGHSQGEDRFWLIGQSKARRILLIVYSIRRSSYGKREYYRIVSARVANKKERNLYKKKN